VRTFDEVEVAGHDALVVAGVVVLPALGGQLQAVAAVVEEERVPGAPARHEALELPPDVGPRGRRRGRVGVGEHADAGLVEAEAVDEAAAHAGHVVEAALELPVRARVVDAHQHRALLPHRRRRPRASVGAFDGGGGGGVRPRAWLVRWRRPARLAFLPGTSVKLGWWSS